MLASTINIQIPYIRESALYTVCCGLAVDGNTFWVSVRFLCHYITLRFFPLHANNISFIIIANIRSHIKHYASLLANLYHCHTLANVFILFVDVGMLICTSQHICGCFCYLVYMDNHHHTIVIPSLSSG